MVRWSRWLAVGTLTVVAAAGCGGGRGSTSPGAGGPPAASTAPATATFGELPSPCGQGTATGATDQGVTSASITIGYGDDAGYPGAPGLDHELSDAVRALIKWCNQQGGINGRQLTGQYYDAKITEVNNVMLSACKQVFMLVGEGFALDGSGEAVRQGCGLPAVPAYAVSSDFANAPLMYQGVPVPVDRFPAELAVQLDRAFPEKVTKTAFMYANFASTQETAEKVRQTYPKFGFQFLGCPQLFNIQGEPDYKPFIQKLKTCGAQVVYYLGAAEPNLQNILDAAAQLDYHPIWLSELNIYDRAMAEWNTAGNGDNVYVRSAFVPVEEASVNRAVNDYVRIVRADGGDVSVLGEEATSSFLLWAAAARSCGSELTRTCVLHALSNVHQWTGGGLHATTDPGSNLPPTCGMALKLDGTRWIQAMPATIGTFDCSPGSAAAVTGPLVDAVKLGPDRVSTKYTK